MKRPDLSQDLMASVVVFLVALPLCLGIAVASGVPPVYGLIAGIIGGLVVGTMSGAPLQVSGPAAGLVVMVWDVVQDHGLATLGLVVFLAGGLQLMGGMLHLGRYFRAVSPALVQGMLAGIGILILAAQWHVMFDFAPQSGGLANLAAMPESVNQAVEDDKSPHAFAGLVGFITLAVMVAWSKIKHRAFKFIPGALVAVIAAALLTQIKNFPIKMIQLPTDIVGNIHLFAWKLDPSNQYIFEVLVSALAMAIIASVESLLCAAALDQMQSHTRTDYDRELKAQGLGNMVAGVFSALPITGVIVRSSTNVQAGGRTRLSAILHAAWLLVFVLLFPQILERIPLAALAGVLVYTGFKLVNLKEVRNLRAFGRWEVAIYVATLGGVVAIDLLAGVLAGFVLSIVNLARKLSKLEIIMESPGEKTYEITLKGSATFFRLPNLAQRIENIPSEADVTIKVPAGMFVDHACTDLLKHWEKGGPSRRVVWH